MLHRFRKSSQIIIAHQFTTADHTKTGNTMGTGRSPGCRNVFGRNQRIFRAFCAVMPALRTERTVLGTGAGFGVNDGAQADFIAETGCANAMGTLKQLAEAVLGQIDDKSDIRIRKLFPAKGLAVGGRSEERRVGKECRL